MSEIIPAIIPKDFDDLEEKLGIIAGRVPTVQVDVLDGSFTGMKAWPYNGDISHFLQITEEAEGFPFWEDISFEAHLMVKNPEEVAEDWIRAGAERIIVHLEAFSSHEELSRFLAILKNRFDVGKTYLGVEVGLAINFDTSLDDLYPHVLEADFIQLMSIKEIGMQGSAFEPETFERLRALKEKFPDTIVSVDGGVTHAVAEELIEHGADRLVIGSGIFSAEDPEEALLDFLDLQ